MGKTYSFSIKQKLLVYDPDEFARYRKGDPSIAPPEALTWKGPGLQNGYGYAETIVERHLMEEGKRCKDKYNIFRTKKTKFAVDSQIVIEAMGKEKHELFLAAVDIVMKNHKRVWLPDLCVYYPNLYFVEVKRDTDRLAEPQIIFAAILHMLLDIKFVVYKVLPIGTDWIPTPMDVNLELPDELFELAQAQGSKKK